MRKLNMTAAVLAAILVLAGCGASAENNEDSKSTASAETTQEAEMAGAYEVNKDLKAGKLPEDAQKAFEKAKPATAEGDRFVPVALLGRQVVSGTNYAVLCYLHDAFATNEKQDALYVVTIYEDMEGNASVLSITDFDLSKIAGNDNTVENEEGITGAFEVNNEAESQALPSDAQNAYDKAVENLADAGCSPIALLGTQVVTGTNYAILCTSVSSMAKEQETSWVVLTIYEDLDGNASVTNTCELDPGAWTDYSQNASAEAAQ